MTDCRREKEVDGDASFRSPGNTSGLLGDAGCMGNWQQQCAVRCSCLVSIVDPFREKYMTESTKQHTPQ